MQKHPLLFFQELIENEMKVKTLRKEFFKMHQQNYLLEDWENDKGDVIEYYNPSPEGLTEKRDFADFLKFNLFEAKNEALKGVDMELLHSGSEQGKNHILKTIFSNITGLLKLLKERTDLGKYSFIEDSLLEIKKSIQTKYNFRETDEQPKIQWLGNTNLLGTLIYELWQGQEKGKGKDKTITKPLIKAQKKDLEELLLNNFLDSKGNPLKPQGVSDYLNTSTSKDSSRVQGDARIEIKNY